MILISNISAPLNAGLDEVAVLGAKSVGLDPKQLVSVAWAKKAVDARRKNAIHLVCSIRCRVLEGTVLPDHKDLTLVSDQDTYLLPSAESSLRPIIIGSGPAGMSAGLALAEAGLRPLILERGRDADRRRRDVDFFWKSGQLDPISNVQFGEGGAGTFSDGKLMTGIRRDLYLHKVLEEFVEAGAPDEIMYLAKPHIGTDKLIGMVKNIRRKIERLGGEYRFEHRLTGLIVKDDRLIGIRVDTPDGEEEISCQSLILAIGHSARDTFEMLYRSGVTMIQKPFSVGARIEHKQSLINKVQYGCEKIDSLGASDYKLAVHLLNGRSAYTFCMCPGGVVVAASSEIGGIATNGMSTYARDRVNANSALLVGVDERDFASKHPLAGMYFQRQIEQTAFERVGRSYQAPAQLVGDFLKRRSSRGPQEVIPSYAPSVTWGALDGILPDSVTETMRLALAQMNQKLRGFSSDSAVLTGPETRSSSPVRIVRDERFQSNIRGLFPCGEGAGYAGGITSASVDGLKVAEALVKNMA